MNATEIDFSREPIDKVAAAGRLGVPVRIIYELALEGLVTITRYHLQTYVYSDELTDDVRERADALWRAGL